MPTLPSYDIPFDHDGNLMPYSKPDWCRPSNVPKAAEWRRREPFGAVLTLVDLKRHRTSHQFYWRDQDGRTYPMFPQDMYAMILGGGVIADGTVKGMWRGIKRAENYGVSWVGP